MYFVVHGRTESSLYMYGIMVKSRWSQIAYHNFRILQKFAEFTVSCVVRIIFEMLLKGNRNKGKALLKRPLMSTNFRLAPNEHFPLAL